ncbi:MAG: PqiC family protein [Lactobacillus sp.]|jgi:uncharacterized lipoprotein YmbA|nr:PqiC family protein [Lactobacillus sp.]
MKRYSTTSSKIFLTTALFMLLAACGTTQPTKFYTLNPMDTSSVKTIDSRNIVIGVDAVNIAGYIERPQIVTIGEGSELNMSEFNRWAEALSYSIQRVVAENVSAYMKNGMAKPLTQRRNSYDYVISIEINKFDGKFNDKAQLDAWWIITDKNGNTKAREYTKLEAPLGSTYNDLVEKQSELLSDLSTKIAKKMSKI